MARYSLTPDDMEKEANHFAMALLMPEEFVRDAIDELRKKRIDADEAVKLLAKKFAVSEVHMTLRLNQLGLFKNY